MKNSLVARSHNSVIKKGKWVHKTSLTNADKLFQEYNWLKFVNGRIAVPNVSLIKNGYKIEYIDGSNLGEVFWQLSFEEKARIIKKYIDYLKNTMEFHAENNKLSELLITKFNERVEVLADWQKLQLVDEINYYQKNIKKVVKKYEKASFSNLMHGDVFLGNTIWKNDEIYLIDPRGASSESDVFGNVFYDVIKLSHSLHGKYDGLIFDYEISKDDSKEVCNIFFREISKMGISKKDILIGEMGLFISMLPIHQDDKKRQENIVQIAKNIFKEI